jgi:Mn-dependent DtxR family transcriptional regulator
MNRELTEFQEQVYRAFLAYQKEHPPEPQTPTIREVAAEIGSVPGSVMEAVKALADEGLMVELPRKTRKWKAVENAPSILETS